MDADVIDKPTTQSIKSKTMRILVVEDEKKTASFIERGLKEQRYVVDVAYDGEEGAYNANGFQITGHVQLSNEDGATWDEYYLGFSDGQCGWLAQAQGRLILSFRAPLPEGLSLPDFEALQLNTKIELMPGLPGVVASTEKWTT